LAGFLKLLPTLKWHNWVALLKTNENWKGYVVKHNYIILVINQLDAQNFVLQ